MPFTLSLACDAPFVVHFVATVKMACPHPDLGRRVVVRLLLLCLRLVPRSESTCTPYDAPLTLKCQCRNRSSEPQHQFAASPFGLLLLLVV